MADTFGTFLDTLQRLEGGKQEKLASDPRPPPAPPAPPSPTSDRQLQLEIEKTPLAILEFEQTQAATRKMALAQERSYAQWDRLLKAEALPQSDIFSIGKVLLAAGGAATPVKTLLAKSGLPQESFFGALLVGRDKGIFQINEEGAEPVVNLTKLGSALIG
jgi:hypothetical protein